MVTLPSYPNFFTKSGGGSCGYVGVATIHAEQWQVWLLCGTAQLRTGCVEPVDTLLWFPLPCHTTLLVLAHISGDIWDILQRCRKGFFLFSARHEKILATLTYIWLSVWDMDLTISWLPIWFDFSSLMLESELSVVKDFVLCC